MTSGGLTDRDGGEKEIKGICVVAILWLIGFYIYIYIYTHTHTQTMRSLVVVCVCIYIYIYIYIYIIDHIIYKVLP